VLSQNTPPQLQKRTYRHSSASEDAFRTFHTPACSSGSTDEERENERKIKINKEK
jgi:hypothetical protein